MAQTNFDRSLARVLVYEGGNDDDPQDPGGRTSRGILQREYTNWRASKGLTPADVWTASDAEIREIYRQNYWDRLRCDELPAGVDFVAFDCAVNSGVAQAAKWAQRACGIVVDGDFGPATREALKRQPDNDLLIADILSRRLAMLQGLRTWGRFGKGWAARVANVKKIGQAWATGSVGPAPVYVTDLGGQRKGRAEDAAGTIIPVTATQVSTGGAFVATTATQVVSQLTAASEVLDWLKVALTIITVLGVAAGVIATIAEKRAHRVKEGTDKAEIDPDADLGCVPALVTEASHAGDAVAV